MGLGFRTGLRTLAGFFLCLMVPIATMVTATAQTTRLPDAVVIEGKIRLDRRNHAACFVAVPPVISGTLTLRVSLADGTVEGVLEGSGEGSQKLPLSCLEADHYGGPEIYTAENEFSGTVVGTVDPETGAFEAEATIAIYASGYYSATGNQYRCYNDNQLQPTCRMPDPVTPQTAYLRGQITSDPENLSGEFEWYTNYCKLRQPSGGTFTKEGCPTKGVWTSDSVSVTWGENLPPEIQGVSYTPQEPDSEDAVTISVTASDPDGDRLTYSWEIDGDAQGASGPSVTWRNPQPGDHLVVVRVSDGIDEPVEDWVSIYVAEHVGAGDADEDGVPDDEDLCPEEWGIGDDGCPEFGVQVGCSPGRPLRGDAVTCSAAIVGRHVGETVEYTWYLDSAEVGTGPTWKWGEAGEGDHTVQVDVIGEGRSATGSFPIEVGETDEALAGFQIVSTACNSGISSDEILSCTVTVQRDSEDIGALTVTWRIDGKATAIDTMSGTTSAWAMDRPAPGDHSVQASVMDPATQAMQVGTAAAKVNPGLNAQIPPIWQLTAGGASVLTLGGWLWVEWLRAQREAAQAAEAARPRDIPDWVFDKRPLKDIWAAQAAEEAARRGLGRIAWNSESQTFYTEDYVKARLDEALQRRMRDDYRRLETTLENNPAWGDLADFVKNNLDNVKHGDRWDPAQMARLQTAVQRLGRLDLGLQSYKDYTYTDALYDTAGQASQNIVIRIGLAVFSHGYSEIALQPFSTKYTMEQRFAAGMSPSDAAQAAYADNLTYSLTSMMVCSVVHQGTIPFLAQVIGRGAKAGARATEWVAAKILPKSVVQFGVRTATRALGAAKTAYHVLGTPVSQLGNTLDDMARLRGLGVPLSQMADKFDDLQRLRGLRVADPRLADLVDDVYDDLTRSGGMGGGAIKQPPTLAAGPHASQTLREMTDDAFRLTTAEGSAARLLARGPRDYQAALRDGLIPRDVHRLVNFTRDKMMKGAIVRAYQKMPEGMRVGVQRIEITGTGARPMSSQATSGWTDFDATVRGPGGSVQFAERDFAARFYREVRAGDAATGMPGLHPRRIDAHMFPGLRSGGGGTAGYSSELMVEWQRADYGFRGRAVTPSRNGNLVFGQTPDAALRTELIKPEAGSQIGVTTYRLETPYRYSYTSPGQPAGPQLVDAARQDIQHLIRHHAGQSPPTSPLDALRQHGKHARRLYWVESAGTGATPPPGLQILDQIKADRQWIPTAEQLSQAVETFESLTHINPGELL